MPLGIESIRFYLANHRQEYQRICLRMIQAQIAVVVSGEDFHSAAQDRVIQQIKAKHHKPDTHSIPS